MLGQRTTHRAVANRDGRHAGGASFEVLRCKHALHQSGENVAHGLRHVLRTH